MRDRLDQSDLWKCLWGIVLAALIGVGAHSRNWVELLKSGCKRLDRLRVEDWVLGVHAFSLSLLLDVM